MNKFLIKQTYQHLNLLGAGNNFPLSNLVICSLIFFFLFLCVC